MDLVQGVAFRRLAKPAAPPIVRNCKALPPEVPLLPKFVERLASAQSTFWWDSGHPDLMGAQDKPRVRQ
jgi:hypothetical protein